MTKPWDADGEKPGSPTSMDILVRWLRTPGKYERWKSEAKKPLLQEITSEINKHGAAKRSPEAVRRKIYNLEQQFKNVTTWLRRKGQLVAYMDSAASEATKQGVLQRCPRYCELATVFQTKNAGSEADTKHGDEATDAMDNGSTEEEQKCAELPIAQGDQKRNPDALDENQRLKKQRKQEASEPQSVLMQERAIEELKPFGSSERSLALAEFQRESESRWNEYCGVKMAPRLMETGEMLAQQLHQREIEHVDAMAKLQLGAEQKRQELQTKCAMILSRHKLRIAGVSEEDVDNMIQK
ncbi:hypothetical protein JG687_00016369 [Phytophthora cactorum]|uniref:Uncharacterized protein n=1 Tax=Phytophthora cactorum TaxID=29920 RepID=A0A8T1TTZ3_9STRA|nr:hypothetical protein PC120_g16228 [Phytophthora cactorum]KAG3087172.1 hypothetical protein PC121_g4693 [Phytophthora cactorum]KAG4055239.1 hypothetical protein PC123_g9662 [Phytophthora cactorum]KAG6947029.1 hypothetical protein JG687_00016369 [Phytophthora cactorum]